MRNTHQPYSRSVLIVALLFLVAVAAPWAGAQTHPTMTAHYIDVGQGDATLVEFPCGAILIDAGAQDTEHANHLIDFLGKFFDKHPKLNRTLDVVFITHTHIDHNFALKSVVKSFNVKRYIDNGMLVGKGKPNAAWIRDAEKAGEYKGTIREISDAIVREADPKVGLTNDEIDPIKCKDCDPKIAILSGRMDENPGWPEESFTNQNNQSLVIRIDFGKASFLFTGDLQEDALDTLVDYYQNEVHQPQMLDVDVWHVGHHGSHNGTTESVLEAMSPAYAVISMGPWDYGKGTSNKFCTWAYGHPRANIIGLLENNVTNTRTQAVTVKAFTSAKKTTDVTVDKAIYGTAWDGDIDITATKDAKYTVTTTKN